MIKRTFIGLAKPRLEYDVIDETLPAPVKVPKSKKVTLLSYGPWDPNCVVNVKNGDKVKTGQKIALNTGNDVVSPVTGTVSSVSEFTDGKGQKRAAVSIDVADVEEIDENFASFTKGQDFNQVKLYLAYAPGKPEFSIFSDADKPIKTVVICGADSDLMLVTRQYVLKSGIEDIKQGIKMLKKITGVQNVIMAVPQHLSQTAASTGAQVKVIDAQYPAANPFMICKDILGQVVPAGKSCEDIGVHMMSAEAVASIGKAFSLGKVPSEKIVTVIRKDETKALVSVTIGTPVKDVLKAVNVIANEGDRIVFGGPFTGTAAYSEDQPIEADADALIVQDSDDIPLVSDYPCINCGECVRACPVNIPVNMLVRLLENAMYEEAQNQYDLDSCIECGLCSYVCVARMPIFQYIRLAKHELARMNTVEATND
ncbi:MAG: 4Fe-4S dicluster domain-containing protein [Desulfobacterales bacterium]|nr:4Fe-4S dicluster domain-containing protein [Desulfobacterales bacterium]MDD4071320.1 4Fe-4S dicluster domain-containing protein [Desulfobacterales bacterium]MDD4392996.1 4Fe-4S dicluster domain-containing protein [Desulfobacterales bacterium]